MILNRKKLVTGNMDTAMAMDTDTDTGMATEVAMAMEKMIKAKMIIKIYG